MWLILSAYRNGPLVFVPLPKLEVVGSSPIARSVESHNKQLLNWPAEISRPFCVRSGSYIGLPVEIPAEQRVAEGRAERLSLSEGQRNWHWRWTARAMARASWCFAKCGAVLGRTLETLHAD